MMVKAIAAELSSSSQETVIELVDEEVTVRMSPTGENEINLHMLLLHMKMTATINEKHHMFKMLNPQHCNNWKFSLVCISERR